MRRHKAWRGGVTLSMSYCSVPLTSFLFPPSLITSFLLTSFSVTSFLFLSSHLSWSHPTCSDLLGLHLSRSHLSRPHLSWLHVSRSHLSWSHYSWSHLSCHIGLGHIFLVTRNLLQEVCYKKFVIRGSLQQAPPVVTRILKHMCVS